MLILETRTQHWLDEADCARSATALAACSGLSHACVELRGELGAGKTTFVRHLLQALGVTSRVKSPTYALMESYSLATFSAWHFDFYRFNDPQEWEDAGFREVYASAGLKLAEWPEQAGTLLPAADLRIELLALTGDERQVRFQAGSERGLGLLP